MMEDKIISTRQGNRIKKKGSWFCGTTHSIGNIERIKKNIEEFPYFAYIIHDKDEGKTPHIHFVVNCRGSRTIKSICEVLDCDYQDVQDTSRPRSCIRYLIHADDPEKFQYPRSEIITSDNDRTNYFFDSINHPIGTILSDLNSLQDGSLTVHEFTEKYRSEFATLPFYQKIKTLEVIKKMARY